MQATTYQVEPFTVRQAEAFDLTAASGGAYRVSVGFPVSYGQSNKTYPVMYVLDADFLFCTMLELTRLRGMTGEISEVVVVGIGYPLSDDMVTVGARRTFDGTVSDRWDPTSPAARDAAAVFAAM